MQDSITRMAPDQDAQVHSNAAGHVVQFYEDDSFLVDAVSAFIGSALAAGDAAVIIATEPHRTAVAELLESRGLDVSRAARQRRLISLDATETLAKFMVDGVPDEALFRTTMVLVWLRRQQQ